MPTPQEEIKAGFDVIKSEFEEFKKQNDAKLEKIAQKGHVGGDIEEKLAKHNTAIDGLVAKFEQTTAALNRLNAGSGDEGESDATTEKKMSAFMSKFMRQGERELSNEETKAFRELERKALSVGSDPNGGYFVRPEVSAIITKKIFETSPVRQFADVITISTDAFEEPADFDEPEALWAGEKTPVAETKTADLQMLRIPTHEMRAKPKATMQILEDASIDIEAWHAAKVAEKFGRKEAGTFINGTGVGMPRGLISYDAGTTYGTIEQVNLGAATLPTADGLIDLQHALIEAYQNNARWLMHRSVAKEVRKLKSGTTGAYLWSLDGNLMDGYQQTLLGRPLHWASDLPQAGAGNLGVVYGDLKAGYLIVDRLGISVLRDPYSAKPYVEFFTRKRVGGGVRNFDAIKIGKFAV